MCPTSAPRWPVLVVAEVGQTPTSAGFRKLSVHGKEYPSGPVHPCWGLADHEPRVLRKRTGQRERTARCRPSQLRLGREQKPTRGSRRQKPGGRPRLPITLRTRAGRDRGISRLAAIQSIHEDVTVGAVARPRDRVLIQALRATAQLSSAPLRSYFHRYGLSRKRPQNSLAIQLQVGSGAGPGSRADTSRGGVELNPSLKSGD
jgi:hypothetical protein